MTTTAACCHFSMLSVFRTPSAIVCLDITSLVYDRVLPAFRYLLSLASNSHVQASYLCDSFQYCLSVGPQGIPGYIDKWELSRIPKHLQPNT